MTAVVRVSGADARHARGEGHVGAISDAGVTHLSASGWVAADGVVLTAAWPLDPWLPPPPPGEAVWRAPEPSAALALAVKLLPGDGDDDQWAPASLRALVRVPALAAALGGLRGAVGARGGRSVDYSWFALLDVPGCKASLRPSAAAPAVSVGDPVDLRASPFALSCPDALADSLSRGVVSNVVGEAALLVDCRCLPGSEGAPLLSGADGGVLGVVLPPPAGNEHVNVFGCVARVGPVLAAAGLAPAGVAGRAGPPPLGPGLAAGVALVRAPPHSWSAGVVVSPSVVLVNRHLVQREAVSVSVSVDGAPGRQFPGRVVYASAGPLDVAVVELAAGAPLPVAPEALPAPAAQPPAAGAPVLAVGYPRHGPSAGLRASATRGVLSKVVRVDGEAAMLQSSATVLVGHSGGLLLDAERGALLGMVTMNTQLPGTRVPTVNFSVPVRLLAPVWAFAAGELSVEEMREQLDAPDSELERLWALRRRRGTLPSRVSRSGGAVGGELLTSKL